MSRDRTPTHRAPPARLALRLPDASSSGIIDVTDLHAGPLPLSLVPPGPPPPPPTRSRPWPLMGLTATLGATLMMLGVAVAVQPTRTVLVRDAAPIDRPLSMQEAAAPVAAEVEEAHRATRRPRGPAETTAVSPAEVGADEPAPKETEHRATRAKAKSDAKRRSGRGTRTTKRGTKSRTKSDSTRPSIPIECVLDPAQCDSGTTRGTTPSTKPGRKAPAPEKLSIAQLKQALASTKADARRCGPEHGADAGTRVRVKLSIDGSTGSVLSATAQNEHAGTSLGRCVATALTRTRFPQFSAPRMGTLYSVRM